jgi:acyl dehydratase
MRAADLQHFVGKEYPAFTADVEKGRLRLFAKAIGSTNAIMTDETAARGAGFAALPAPPTLAYSLTMDCGQSFNALEDMKIPLAKCVHGAQGFRYVRPLLAGDTVSGSQKIVSIVEKKGGALLFIDMQIRLENQRGEHVCDLNQTVIVRN